MLDDLIQERRQKLQALKKAGVDPFPITVRRTLTIAEARKRFTALSKARTRVSLVGRIMSLRDQGGLIFVTLADETGTFQGVLKKDTLKNFSLLKNTLDRGDFVCMRGFLFKTKKGEASLSAQQVQFSAKSLRPLPDQWYGLEETELRLRQRYLEMVLNPATRDMFRRKAVFWNTFRQELLKEGFVETFMSVLEPTPGGAEAEPFVTHHNALDTDFYLRISLELPLKKMLVGGFEKVFEIGHVFRNEGIDKEHLQDYTALEFYWAWHDYRDLMKFIEKLYKTVIKATCGTLVTTYDGKKINWGKKWTTVDYVKAFMKANKLDPIHSSVEELYKHAKGLGVKLEPNLGRGRLVDLIYKKTVRPHLIQPCFLINPPVFIEPLAKRSLENPEVVERFQVLAGGTELGKGFSELNDPIDQRARFEEQAKLREAGDKEAQMMDEDFVEALEYGMPPATGFGVADRLFSMLMDTPIRETVPFPLLRRKE